MIRINLSGAPRPKKGKRASVPTMEGAGPNPMILVVVVLLIGLIGNIWYYHKLTSERDYLASETQKADLENRRLAQVKAKYDEAERQKEIYRKRVEVIDQLRSKQAGPVELLATIGDTINKTDAVWLLTMKDDGNNISIEGTALGANAVANLIGNLRKTGFFKTVEIKETFQDDTFKNMQAFQFTLVCEKQEKKS
jgi:type IV pilus assembly protein PilN